VRELAKRWINGLLLPFRYRISHLPANRFDAMSDMLQCLRRFGYEPRMVIDGGANMGQWTRLACGIFPEATFHLIEPQAACRASLEETASHLRSSRIHAAALTESGVKTVQMIGADGTTGAWISDQATADSVEVAAVTLDDIITVEPGDRALLKLDLENHELVALRGGLRLLQQVEVVITEVSFYRPSASDSGPLFGNILTFLRDCGFDLYDFASLASPIGNGRLRTGDAVFLRRTSPLAQQRYW
jgi:FkbM family methyltransferase